MERKEKPPVGMIVGPTASGKTALSVELAERLNAEIVSADSIQVYKGLDIGSAKPTMAERRGIPHHLLDAVETEQTDFSVAAFQKMASAAIEDIVFRGKFPLVVGGTGLYINALSYPLTFSAIPPDPSLRAKLEALEAESPGALYARLSLVDPVTAKRLHPNDQKRLVRALEVYTLTGKPLSEHGNDFSNEGGAPIPYEPRIVGLTMRRETLYARIETRVDEMMKNGLLQETEALKAKGLDASYPALQGLGYKQLLCYLDGTCSLEEAVERIKRETRHFAKRQMTWFRRDKRIVWLDIEALDFSELLRRAQGVLEGETLEACEM